MRQTSGSPSSSIAGSSGAFCRCFAGSREAWRFDELVVLASKASWCWEGGVEVGDFGGAFSEVGLEVFKEASLRRLGASIIIKVLFLGYGIQLEGGFR